MLLGRSQKNPGEALPAIMNVTGWPPCPHQNQYDSHIQKRVDWNARE